MEKSKFIGTKEKLRRANQKCGYLKTENKQLKEQIQDWQRAFQEAKDEQFDILRNSIPKSKIQDKVDELNNQIKVNKKDLAKNEDWVNKGFGSIDNYFKWKMKKQKENEFNENTIKVLKDILKGN